MKIPKPKYLWTTLILLTVLAVFALPYLWIVSSGFKYQTAIFKDMAPVSWTTFLPIGAVMDNFEQLFTEKGVGRALANSLVVAAIDVIGALIVCTLAAYALTRIRFRGRGVVFALILATFMLPVEAMVVPLYRVVSGLGIQDTLWAVALPGVASVFGLFLLRQTFDQVPTELDEAARIDGAGHIRVFWSVILPNVRTALATLILIKFLFSWNAFLWPLVAIQTQENQVIQVAVAHSAAPDYLPNWGLTFAGTAVATVPLLILFLFLQRYFVRGLATTGLK
ncbi:carbohydrate ABC transporter permease [Pseudarthrobacter enclensis]|uniref:ABC-type glycerol-3-phosphate transport system permease component n=1 Tax=Pseudarthrobacter enclensis TaxID=993070 RepID=A0ABT9RTW2_9MICC|nr:carbohydrate ABC transporter permease [Pseudarthrobacter enclensis]MDP9888680.1 ABC-type glycerol-3-phosphate transport system permease component [Pseudarthrobacter enclensis]